MPLRRLLLTASAAFFGLTGAALAQSQPYPQVETPNRWRLEVGGGVTYGFSATGNTGSDYSPVAWVSGSYKDVVYANGLDGIGWNAIKRDDFRAGLQLRPRYAAGDIEGSDLERPGFGADATLYAFKRVGGVVVGGRLAHDATGDSAGTELFVSAGHQRVTPVGLLRATAYARAIDDDRAQAYYGVTPAQAPGSGYAAFEPDGGLSGVGAALLLAVPVGDRFGVGGFVNYEQRLGDIKDSPLIDDEGVWRAGLIGVVRFNSGG